MVRINFYIQSLLFAISIILGACSLFDGSSLFLLLYVQVALGFSQYIGGVVLITLVRSNFLKYYLISSSILLLTYFIWAEIGLELNDAFRIIGVFILPWLLAIFYWFISYKLYFTER